MQVHNTIILELQLKLDIHRVRYQGIFTLNFEVADVVPLGRNQPRPFDLVSPPPVQRIESHVVPVVDSLEEVHGPVGVRVVHGIQVRW